MAQGIDKQVRKSATDELAILRLADALLSTFAVGILQAIHMRSGSQSARYIREFRIRQAQVLLSTTCTSVGIIATTVGFDSESSFSRAFVSVSGQRPGQLRAMAKPQRRRDRRAPRYQSAR